MSSRLILVFTMYPFLLLFGCGNHDEHHRSKEIGTLPEGAKKLPTHEDTAAFDDGPKSAIIPHPKPVLAAELPLPTAAAPLPPLPPIPLTIPVTVPVPVPMERDHHDDSDEDFKDENDKDGACSEANQISEQDVNSNGGYVITKPGIYVLCEDIKYKPKGSQSKPAIRIMASNVTLDLASHTLSLGTSSKTKILGISADSVSSLNIINGAITDFTDAAIRISDSENLVMENLDILRTGVDTSFGGLQINDSSDVLIDKIRSLYNFGLGMYLLGVVKATVKNSHFDDNVGGLTIPELFPVKGAVGVGAYVDSSADTQSRAIHFEDCTFSRNQGGAEGAGMEIGPRSTLGAPSVRDVTILRCEFLDNHMNGLDLPFQDSTGLALILVDNFLIRDTIASGQRHPSIPGPDAIFAVSGATGFSINGSKNGLIENCQANDNSGQGNTSIGIRVRASQGVVVKNCECSGNINTASGVAFGFYTDTDGLNLALPVFPAFDSSIVFDSNVAQNNSSESGLSGGFKFATIRNSSVLNNISQENTGYGMLLIDANMPDVVLGNIFENNIVQSNTLAGFSDQVSGSNNAYSINIARSNGPGGIVNYVGLPAGTPIVTWSITGGFPPVINPFANLDIVP